VLRKRPPQAVAGGPGVDKAAFPRKLLTQKLIQRSRTMVSQRRALAAALALALPLAALLGFA